MIRGKGVFTVLLSFLLLGGSVRERHTPLFFALEYDSTRSYKSQQAAIYNEEGLMMPFQIDLLSKEGFPVFYASDIRTTVCDDEICEIMNIRLFWDLVGDYVGYDTLSGHPLTKFDHDPFSTEDYEKLHELLSNDGSILKFKTKEELIDKQKVKASDVVDGTTGATALEIKEEVVEGALYTSYTMWHIAYNGSIKNMLTEHTGRIYNETLRDQFIQSDRSAYELFAVERFTEEDFEVQRPFLLKSMREGIPLLRKFILKDMPDQLWQEEEMQSRLCAMFSTLDVNSKTLLLDKFKNSDKVHLQSLALLSKEIREMNKNQLIAFLKVIMEQKELNTILVNNLKDAAGDNHFQYAYLIYDHAEGAIQ